ncbi:MAG: hypothetical protein J7K21_06185, partial [Desulfurococcales archaeon]|nr:hypothetical protein [Desulfurococcales archaeon]
TNPEVKKSIGKYFETIENIVLPFISLEKELVTETLIMDPFTIIGVAKEYDVLEKYTKIAKSLNDLGVRSRVIVVTKSCTSDPYVFCIWNDHAIKALRDLTALILFRETYEAYMVLQRIAPRGHIIILPQNFAARSWFDKNELVVPVESMEPEDLIDEIVINIINNSDKYKKLVASHIPETYSIDYFASNFIKTILPLLNR